MYSCIWLLHTTNRGVYHLFLYGIPFYEYAVMVYPFSYTCTLGCFSLSVVREESFLCIVYKQSGIAVSPHFQHICFSV